MQQIPDAPWIREAERNGYDTGTHVCCPVCGEICDEIYLDNYRNACGCNRCISTMDAYDWYQDELEKGRPE